MAYWLFKSEPDEYSIDDLQNEARGFASWDGIRNYQARNHLRDQVKVGDGVLFYHSSCKDVGIAGTAKVVKAAYPDPTQFDSKSKYYDAKATTDNPRWYCVDVAYVCKFPCLLPLATIKQTPQLAEMALLRHGRLSIQPVSRAEWQWIVKQAV